MGTGTYNVSGDVPGIDEVQAGSYVFMDTKYRSVGIDFECALTVLATVISRPTPHLAITDAGAKVHDLRVRPARGEGPRRGHAEEAVRGARHGRLRRRRTASLKVGDKIEFIVSHGCTTINLHDRYFAVRDGRLEAVWPIAARGKSQ